MLKLKQSVFLIFQVCAFAHTVSILPLHFMVPYFPVAHFLFPHFLRPQLTCSFKAN